MDREDVIKAVDRAFDSGIEQIYSVFVQGLVTGEKSDDLAARFGRGLAFHCDAHAKTTAIVIDYFKGFK